MGCGGWETKRPRFVLIEEVPHHTKYGAFSNKHKTGSLHLATQRLPAAYSEGVSP